MTGSYSHEYDRPCDAPSEFTREDYRSPYENSVYTSGWIGFNSSVPKAKKSLCAATAHKWISVHNHSRECVSLRNSESPPMCQSAPGNEENLLSFHENRASNAARIKGGELSRFACDQDCFPQSRGIR